MLTESGSHGSLQGRITVLPSCDSKCEVDILKAEDALEGGLPFYGEA